jgi:hypothetical protein
MKLPYFSLKAGRLYAAATGVSISAVAMMSRILGDGVLATKVNKAARRGLNNPIEN